MLPVPLPGSQALLQSLEPQPAASAGVNVLDLELLHFYMSATSFSITSAPRQREFFQVDIFKMAFASEMVLRGILALSALHLCHVRPDDKKRYLVAAALHHDTALQGYQSGLKNITPENEHACQLFKIFLDLFNWAAPGGIGNSFLVSHDGPQEIVEWIKVVRVGHAVLFGAIKGHSPGPLAPLWKQWEGRGRNRTDDQFPADELRYNRLARLWTPSTESSLLTAAQVETLVENLKVLQNVHTLVFKDSVIDSISALLAWFVLITEEYMTMLHDRIPEAWVLLAHFCLSVKRMERYWWAEGKAAALLLVISRFLGNAWNDWIQWPLQEVPLVDSSVGHKSGPTLALICTNHNSDAR